MFYAYGREKTGFLFDMFDFGGREEASYDEVAICISTVVGALSKVKDRRCRVQNEVLPRTHDSRCGQKSLSPGYWN